MLRIFMTGDNHIGLKYANHEHSDVLVSSRISAFEKMVKTANEENCDLFVITGDLFENTTGPAKKEIKTLLDYLSGFTGTVAILPGNHDYYDDEVKVWRIFKEMMASYDNILLLKEYRPYPVNVHEEVVMLYPALCTSKHSDAGLNNIGWIKEFEMEKSAYHLGIAHGSVEGESLDDEGKYFPMKYEELESIPVDAWLIGHTHVPFPRHIAENYTFCGKIFNAGTHVQTDVACNTEGLCFIVEIAEDKTVRAKKVVTGNLRFYRKNIEVVAEKMEQILIDELKECADNSVVEVILTGAVTIDEYEERHQILTSVLNRFLEGTYNDYKLSKLISKELIDAEFSETSFSAKFLTSLLDHPKEAQLAYELLESLKEGK